MKFFIVVLFMIFTFMLIPQISGNPLPVPVMNELKIESNHFILEIVDSGMFMNLNGCFLTSRTDTAYFNSGIPGNIDYLLITPDSLLSSFNLNPAGDELSFHCPGMGYLETIIFGDSNNCQIRNPLSHQSICLDISGGTYYLDNTPTLGSANDYVNAFGTLDGYVTNLAGDSLEGVKISGQYLLPLYTNASGYFTLNELAIFEELVFQKAPYPDGYLWLQIWPDSIQTIHVIIENLVEIAADQSNIIISDFQLLQNYPNPFNSRTMVRFYLPSLTSVEINICDVLGKKIRSVFKRTINSGWHRTSWDGKDDTGKDVASGIYIYYIVAGREIKSGKMLLLR